MRKLVAAVGLALAALCGLAAGQAKAADAEVRYTITNGGIDVRSHGSVNYFPAGQRDGPKITWAGSGESLRLPAGTYSVHVEFDDGDAHKQMWIDNQAFAGTVEKTVEVNLPITEVRYVITNGGVDVRGHGEVRYFPPRPARFCLDHLGGLRQSGSASGRHLQCPRDVRRR